MELLPSSWEPGLCKQRLDRVAGVALWGWEWGVEEMSRLAGGGLHRLALQPGLEVWPVLLQLLIVSGNCKELVLVVGAQAVPGLWVVLSVPADVGAA